MSEYVTMDIEVKNLLGDMLNIGSIQPGQRMSKDGKRFYQRNYLSSLQRTFVGDSRIKTAEFIDLVIQRCSRILKDYKDTQYHQDVLDALELMRQGIRNLCMTYDDDTDIKSRFQLAIIQINHWLPKKNLDEISS